MMAIYKYQLALVDRQSIDMPSDANILSVQLQNGIPTIWAEVSPDAPIFPRRFAMICTGETISASYSNRKYLATLQLHTGIVLHVYQIRP